ncbi:uncharacterized protein LOC135335877 isoform X2 [Halichondria panicea]|uniref:uncharacterized protein LOC135335877 isoform X2 n=1 Tax=Halichondria panicea TaxID=6063 RepID=UPI00312B4022
MSDDLARQLYYASSGGRDQKVLDLLQRGAPPNNSDYYTREYNGYTPLHCACAYNNLRSAELLIKFGAIVAAKANTGWTPLHYACFFNSKATAKLLLEHHCPTDIKTSGGQTAADLAREKWFLGLTYYVERFQPGPRDPLSSYPTLEQLSQLECDQWLQLGVHLRLENDQLETIKKSQHPTAATLQAAKIKNIDMQWKDIVEALVSIGEYKLTESVCTQQGEGESALSVSAFYGWLDCVKRLVETVGLDPKDHLLVVSVKGNQNQRVVEYLLAECHCDPNVTDKEGKTPLDLANNPKIIKLLLKHGAKAANVYKEHSKLIGKLSSERPPHLPLSVLVIGDGGVGKSTLLKSILSSKGFWSLFQKARPVDDVDAKTVGIIPYEIYTKEFGRIIYFDFAGQKEFYTSHCAILENAVQTSPPIIILCAKLVESEQAIVDSMYRWLTLVQNQCTNLKGKAHVIVVGSHADQVKEMEEDPRAKEEIFAPIIKQFPKFEFTEFIPMDCRFADSDDMKKAKEQIKKSSAILRSPETISLNAHTFYIYLAESFKDDLALSLGNVYERIKSDLNEDLSKRTQDILSFIPSTIPHLVEICDQLHKRGLLLFLRNDSSPEKSFLVIDQATLLSRVTGTVFAPESFRQHCKLASSTGVVPLLKFKKEFDGFDIEMLVAYMSHLELCFEILDEQVLDFISKEIVSSTDRDASVPESDTRYLFFPGLIRIETPEQVWKDTQSVKYHFGWILETSQDTEFFDPRCLQVLILRIVFTFRLAPASKVLHHVPTLQKFCSIWKNGIYWCNDDGITAHFELAENGRSLALKIRSDTVRPEGLIHRSRILSTIRETVECFGRNVNVIESVIDPDEVVKHPLKNPSDLPLVNIKDIAAAVSSNRGTIKSTQQVAFAFKHLLQFDTYAGLDQTIIQCIHSDKNPKKNEKISRAFISYFSSQISDRDSEEQDQVARNSRMYKKILGPSIVKIQSVSPRQEVVQALETWRSETEGTYSCLREVLNKYSVFAGRNPLDLAGVAHDDIDPSVFSISGDELTDHQIPSTPTLGELSIDMNQKSTIREHHDTVSVVKTPSSDEGSLSSERLQHSAAPVQRVGATSAGTGDSQLHTKREIKIDTAITGQLEHQMKYGDAHIQDPGTTSLHQLMVKHGVTDEQLDREIEQDDLAPVAMHFDNVELYLNPLKLTGNEKADVKRDAFVKGNQVAVINCLSIWKGHKPSGVTFRALIRILLDLRKEEIATKICQYLADGNSQVYTQRADKSANLKPDIMYEGSLSSERLQYSADLVQRVGATISSSTSEVHTRRGLPANRVTLQDLVSRYSLTDKQLNSEIGDSDIPYLAEYFDGVKIYASAMGLTPAQQADVNRLYCNEGTQVAMTECLILWKRHDPFAATYKALLELLLGLRKDEIADNICQHLSQ